MDDAGIELVQTPQAFRRLHALLVEYERDLPPDLRHGAEPTLQQVEHAYAPPSGAYVARFGEEFLGCVGLRLIDPSTALLQRLYVRPEYRGKGIARALTVMAIEAARMHGCARIVLDTDAERLSGAAALYRSLGFTECEPYGEVDYQNPTFMSLTLR